MEFFDQLPVVLIKQMFICLLLFKIERKIDKVYNLDSAIMKYLLGNENNWLADMIVNAAIEFLVYWFLDFSSFIDTAYLHTSHFNQFKWVRLESSSWDTG